MDIEIDSQEKNNLTADEIQALKGLLQSYPIHNHDGKNSLDVATSLVKKALDAYKIIIPTAATMGEDADDGNAVRCDANGKIYKAAATDDNTVRKYIGILDGSYISGKTPRIITKGVKSNYSDLVPGSVYYLTNTPGVISTSPGTITKQVAVAIDKNNLLIL